MEPGAVRQRRSIRSKYKLSASSRLENISRSTTDSSSFQARDPAPRRCSARRGSMSWYSRMEWIANRTRSVSLRACSNVPSRRTRCRNRAGRGVQQHDVQRVTRYFAAQPACKSTNRTIDFAGRCRQPIIDKYGDVHVAGRPRRATGTTPVQVRQPHFGAGQRAALSADWKSLGANRHSSAQASYATGPSLALTMAPAVFRTGQAGVSAVLC